MNEPAQLKSVHTDPLAATLAYIEAHLFNALSISALANVAGLSVFHFSRCFTARFGESVIAYVRARRMQAAAERLANGAPSLAELAFDCGFESQEAFTRAFRRDFGVPPGKYKREVFRAKKENPMAERMDVKLDMTLRDGLTRREAFTVAGITGRFDDTTKADIPALWPKLIPHLPLKGQMNGHSYGVCWATGEGSGVINYMAGVEVGAKQGLPPGFERLAIAAQSYLVFHIALNGPNLHPQLQAAMRAIWSDTLPNSKWKLAQAPDFEFYPENFNPMQKGMWIDYYIPVVA
jgi:AraC family transcriptional regulator